MNNNNKIKVLLVDDHEVVRAGFRILLSSQPFIGQISDLDRGELVTQEYERFKPDVVVMDLSMPGIGGLETIRRLQKLDSDAVILVYSIHDEAIYVERALEAGAMGYVSKNSAAEVLAEAVKSVAEGKRYIEESLLPEVDDVRHDNIEHYRKVLDLLSPREFDVFCRLAKGMTAHEVAADMHLGYKTIANYNTQIKSKLRVNTAADLANIAVVLGIIKP
ncbi:MAG: response regulator transcription factor [Pseudomonadota bacterium]|uniref:DNA binding response regulator, LuxR family n=1 Tax=Methylophaga aminisulfidivorans MP TaxID=1026882 RepID=F5SVG3_9GAMM|nr:MULTISPECIES: response regulator transcription factor [Methylophaga]EGL55612.1 DNA binding response regulator, LuxR family [Methylophaga aminisulfidivorans MP]MEC9412987.1 response regulator transcription factor [Pseudomonadota bacterium]HIC45492.1 response regulator transcription factor [Methylophaga sp.]HIM40475.1 response regulator transcription factor [Methylophaga aminisulfidivorans]